MIRIEGLPEEERAELEELITTFEGHQDSADNNNKPPNFPVPAGDAEDGPWKEVEVRQRTTPLRPSRSKTFNFDSPKSVTRRRDDTFEAKGATKIVIGDDPPAPIERNQRLQYSNGQIQRVTGARVEVLKSNVELRKGTKLLGKKDVEMKDTVNTSYLFQFDSAKEAKQFVDTERTRSTSFSEKTTIKSKLLRLLGKRSSRDLLESKGILKNEPIFGNTLADVYGAAHGIPAFIMRVVDLIERPKNIRSMGLYRTSGNLAIIQKIRFEVDCGKLDILNEYSEDVDVLTGCLKLFFRELKELLIPFEVCQRLMEAMDHAKEKTIRIIDELPEANREVLLYLLRHLVKVCDYKEDNKMDVYNLSVCWGPSLIGIPETCVDIVVQTSNVSKVMEYLINFYRENYSEMDRRISTDGSAKKLVQRQPSKEGMAPNRTREEGFEPIRRVIELIECNIDVEGIYRKCGSTPTIDKILRAMEKGKFGDLDKFKGDVHELCSALKKYLSTLPQPLIPKKQFEQYCGDCDKLSDDQLEKRAQEIADAVPRRETLLLLLRHLRKVVGHEGCNKMSLHSLTSVWTGTLLPPADQKLKDRITKFNRLLEALIGLGDDLPDLVREQLRIRESRYDNVPDVGHVRGEANILEEKTETKL